tara:strand:+ start:77 stop:454 length:378 start_codon:yes stop_codon:yes gene_type:complete
MSESKRDKEMKECCAGFIKDILEEVEGEGYFNTPDFIHRVFAKWVAQAIAALQLNGFLLNETDLSDCYTYIFEGFAEAIRNAPEQLSLAEAAKDTSTSATTAPHPCKKRKRGGAGTTTSSTTLTE